MNRYLENLTKSLNDLVLILDGVYPKDSPEGRLVADVSAALDRFATMSAQRRATKPLQVAK